MFRPSVEVHGVKFPGDVAAGQGLCFLGPNWFVPGFPIVLTMEYIPASTFPKRPITNIL